MTRGASRLALAALFAAGCAGQSCSFFSGFGDVTKNVVVSPLVRTVNPVQSSCLGTRWTRGEPIPAKFRVTFLVSIDPRRIDTEPGTNNDDFAVYAAPLGDGGTSLPSDGPCTLKQLPITSVTLEAGDGGGIAAAEIAFDDTAAGLPRPYSAVLVIRSAAQPVDGGADAGACPGWDIASTPLATRGADGGTIELPAPVVSFMTLVDTPDLTLPKIVGSTVPNGATNVEPHQPIVFDFDHPACFVNASAEPVSGMQFAQADGGSSVVSASPFGMLLDTDYTITFNSSGDLATMFNGLPDSCPDGGRCDEFPPTDDNRGLPFASTDLDGGPYPATSTFTFHTGSVKIATPVPLPLIAGAPADMRTGDFALWTTETQAGAVDVHIDGTPWRAAAILNGVVTSADPADPVDATMTSNGYLSIAFTGPFGSRTDYPFVGEHLATATSATVSEAAPSVDHVAVNFPHDPSVQGRFYLPGEKSPGAIQIDEGAGADAVRAYVQVVGDTSADVTWRTVRNGWSCQLSFARADLPFDAPIPDCASAGDASCVARDQPKFQGGIGVPPYVALKEFPCSQIAGCTDCSVAPLCLAGPVNADDTIDDRRATGRWTANLKGLHPGTYYHYAVSCTGTDGRSPVVLASNSVFRTSGAAERTASFVAFSDVHEKSSYFCERSFRPLPNCTTCPWGSPTFEGSLDALAGLASSEPIDLYLGAGDIAHCEQHEDRAMWSSVDDEYLYGILYRFQARNLLAGAPLFAVPGNHDFVNDVSLLGNVVEVEDEATEFERYFSMPGGTHGGGDFYSFNYGPAHFIGINDAKLAGTCGDGTDRGPAADVDVWATPLQPKVWNEAPSNPSPQASFVINDLEANAAARPWSVAFLHVPLEQLKNDPPAPGARACPGRSSAWIEAELRRRQVPMAIEGHDHGFAILNTCPLALTNKDDPRCPPAPSGIGVGLMDPNLDEPVALIRDGTLGGSDNVPTFVKVDIDGDLALVRGFTNQHGVLANVIDDLGDGTLRPVVFAMKRHVSTNWERPRGLRRIYADPCTDGSGKSICLGTCWWPSQLPPSASGGLCIDD